MVNSVDFVPPSRALHYGQPFRFDFQTRSSGDLIDADANPTITITDSGGTDLVTAQSTGREGVGLYYYDYTIPSTGPAGQWLITLSYAISTVSQTTKHNFVVQDKVVFDPTAITSVTSEGVRYFCGQIAESVVTDEEIQLYIFETGAYVDQIKATSADTQAVLLAKFFDACVATFSLYMSKIAEQINAIAMEDVKMFLNDLKARRERWMDLITGTARQTPAFTNIVPAVALGSISTIRMNED